MYYVILIISVLSLIFAIVIIRQAIKDAKDMPMDFEVLSRAEMAAIKQDLDKVKDYPVYDENYLNECIEKAKTNLSKIKDVDKCLDEIRGVDKDCQDEFSPEAYFGEDEEEIEALKEKLAKYRDYSDVSEDDQEFLSHIRSLYFK